MPILLKDRTRASLAQNMLESGSAVKDLKIVCDDGVVETYQAVFAWASSFMRRQLVAKFVMEDSGKRKDDVTLHLPGVSVEVVTTLANILVRGEVANLSVIVKRELQILWKSLGIDRVEFEKLDISDMKESKKVKNTRNASKPTKSRAVHIIPDDTPKKQKTTVSKQKIHKFQVTVGENTPHKALALINNEQNSVTHNNDENNRALVTLDNYDDVSIIVPGYENVEVDDKSIISSFENVPVFLDNSETSFEIPSDISIFPAIDDKTLEEQKINVLKRKQSEVDAYIEQRLKASKLDRTPKQTPKIFSSKPQDSVKKFNRKETALKPTKVVDPEVEPLACYVCNSTRDKEKRALNLKNVFYLKNHISKCLYMSGRLFAAIDPGDENRDIEGKPVDEFGLKNGFWYRCEIEGCWLQQKKGVHGQVCYKVFAIHMASQHGVVEAVMVEDGNDAALELVQKIRDNEERRNQGKINHKLLQDANKKVVLLMWSRKKRLPML